MPEPSACPPCLRRAHLLARLGAYIERTAPTGFDCQLLRLANEDLVDATVPNGAPQILASVQALSRRQLEQELAAADCWACCRHGDAYPDSLRDGADAPWALIGRGDANLLTGLDPAATVAIVGSRRATSYGREVARILGRDLAAAGITVVSGMAFGVDACAHRGALDAGRTIAVLGCGADIAYPAANRSLWRRIQESGLVLSELPPGATPWRWTFPARNRIMAAMAGMTVIVEAAARSGSLITMGLAADLGRNIGAVPGPVTSPASAGPNELLAGGACVVRGAQDVLDAILGPARRRIQREQTPQPDAIRSAAQAILAEGRVPTEILRGLLSSYGGEESPPCD